MEVPVVGRLKQLLVSLLLLSLIAWIVSGLAASDKMTVPAFPLIIDLSSMVEPFRYLLYLVFLAFIFGALIMLIRDRRIVIETMKNALSATHREGQNSRPLHSLMTWVVICGLSATAIFFLSRLNLESLNPLTSTGNQSANSTGPSSGATTPNSPGLPPNFFIVPALLFVAIAVAGGVMAVQAVREIREESEEVPMKSDEILEQKAFNVVREAISTITNEGDFRTAIINCYQRLCELLAKHNCQIEDHQTVQEFKTSALKALSIPDEYLSALTGLFEEARYSLHEMDEAKRNDALGCLTEIRDSLGGDGQ